MRAHSLVRRLRLLILLLPISAAALAQIPPPPPPPLGPPPVPPGNPVTTSKTNLGKTLFWDEQLSSSRTVACGSCHQASSGGSDSRVQSLARATHPGPDGVADTPDDVLGSPGVVLREASGTYTWSALFGFREQVTGRRAPSFINAAYAPELFWDGRARGTFTDPLDGHTIIAAGGALEIQSLGPPVSSAEMGHLGRDWNDVAARVAESNPLALAPVVPTDLAAWIGARTYPDLFEEAFGSGEVTPARIALAIATYERALFSNQTPFDSAATAVLTPQEVAGRALFGQLPCARCHTGPLTSDNQYHYIGVRPAAEDSGRAAVTHLPADLGAFRTPALRNVALRPAFMHDGRFRTLTEVIDFYDRGGDFNAPNKDPLIRPLNLGPQQRAQLEAFLRRPLTDPRVANGSSPFDRPALYGESSLVPAIVDAGASSAAGETPQIVALEPAIAGNPTFTLGVFGALAGAGAVLVVDEQVPPVGAGIPASGSFARVATVLAGDDGDGHGSATLAIPDDPTLLGRTLYARWYVADPSAPDGVAASAAARFRIFGAHGAGALVLAAGDPALPRVLRLHPSAPNPFSDDTRIRFDLFRGANVRLAVYDVSGREVRRLMDGAFQTPGSYSVRWDGLDNAGRWLPAGLYFYRVESDRAVESGRVVVSR